MHPIVKAQMEGRDLNELYDVKVEYQLRTSKGRVMAIFDCPIRAQENAEERAKIHGSKMPTQHLYKVTTVTEKL